LRDGCRQRVSFHHRIEGQASRSPSGISLKREVRFVHGLRLGGYLDGAAFQYPSPPGAGRKTFTSHRSPWRRPWVTSLFAVYFPAVCGCAVRCAGIKTSTKSKAVAPRA
jgi:hypothetical protein